MKNIIFDWSGVVKDAVVSQLWIINQIFKTYDVAPITLEELKENWEQPYQLFYKKYLPAGFVEEARAHAYREAVLSKECPKSSAISGIVEVIKKLKEQGMFIAVVSSDLPEKLLPEMTEYYLENTFNEVITDVDDKVGAVQKIIEKHNLNLNDTFFIGDSNHEIEVAQKLGIKSVAVTWGFSSEQKLRAYNPDHIVHDVQELERVIL